MNGARSFQMYHLEERPLPVTCPACHKPNRSEAALVAAGRSWRLRHTAESARISFLAAAAMGDTPRALRWRDGARACPGA